MDHRRHFRGRLKGWRLHRLDRSSFTATPLAARKARNRRREAIAKISRRRNRAR